MLWLRNFNFTCLLIVLASCGFKPLYIQDQHDVLPEFAQIKIQSIADRQGQRLRNQLLTFLTPYGAPARPRYELIVNLKFTNRDLAILKDTTTSRSEIILHTSFTLRDLRSGKDIYQESTTSSADYNTLMNSPYATTVSEEDAKRRLVDAVAQTIRLSLGSFLAASKAEANTKTSILRENSFS